VLPHRLVQLELDGQHEPYEYRFPVLSARLPWRHHRYHAHSLFVAVSADTPDGFHFADGSILAHDEADVYRTVDTHPPCTCRIAHIFLDKGHHRGVATLKLGLLLNHRKDLVFFLLDDHFCYRLLEDDFSRAFDFDGRHLVLLDLFDRRNFLHHFLLHHLRRHELNHLLQLGQGHLRRRWFRFIDWRWRR